MEPSPRPHFFDHTPDSLGDVVAGWGMPRFRAKQVFHWVYGRGVVDPLEMGNLSAADRGRLKENLAFIRGRVLRRQDASDGTHKLLVGWGAAADDPLALAPVADKNGFFADATECVMIPAGAGRSGGDAGPRGAARRTACLSSQVGCPVGCSFCASGLGGLDGNLTAGQIVQQAWMLDRELKTSGDPVGRLTNVVFMGMGEPMANLKAVVPALRTLTAAWGMNLSARKITVSTVGVVPGIRRLGELDLPVTLALSLHAPNDELRRQIIPWASFVTIEELVAACRGYFEATGREVTLEYILLGGFNDGPQHAAELAAVAKRLRSNVNLIRYNEVRGLPHQRPSSENVHRFQKVLRDRGVNAHLRASRGRDIAAACGQLRYAGP
ncbi:23S rRNA (adenine(2503)-C(2))-methyltransferase RlmN [Phycisphaera mikurensis]|uniref:Probable dual-specificity RNA methyltransferase RlmN n=1 Tax=Phycisphaera mikurensis (strain NBRC 102666 / KCTC 22515 / FYK2301M01) TaxID=1142394 RepID=I0IFY0_PHYMF|nr:23S rRNA (adenine(2503)-C(2))-methyltransferase RlmN [Phycisphaera mikurensis]MBB6440445.1 23S rRNA (adenine2503-C2)-methyltransferase [Phycisphaera mikurensis]BAM04168.1 ribosomal RNA large subunit methyltransferase N [Phycisphaera mikurensis NBRC 102666]